MKALKLFFLVLCFSPDALSRQRCIDLFTAADVQSLISHQQESLASVVSAFKDSNLIEPQELKRRHELLKLIIENRFDSRPLSDAQAYAETLAFEDRELFIKMSELSIKAKQGNADQLTEFLQSILDQGRYQEWLEIVARAHFGLSRLKSNYDPRKMYPETESLVRYTQSLGINGFDVSYVKFERPLPWINQDSLERHFKKRTEQDGYLFATTSDLLAAANRFILSQNKEQILFIRPGNGMIKYDLSTKELAVISENRKIVTYYILDSRYRRPDQMDHYIVSSFLNPQSGPPSRNR